MTDATHDSVYVPILNNNGEKVLISEELMRKLDLELETWHLRPWLRTRTETLDGIVTEKTCRSDGTSFPPGVFDGK